MSDYTPSTEEVREMYWECSGEPRRSAKSWAEFDRWLASVKADAIRDVATGLIDWDVMHGHSTGTTAIQEDHETADWLWAQADRIEKEATA